MKKLILTFGIFLAGVLCLNAQDKAATAANNIVTRLTKECGLTPDQVAKVQPVVESFVSTREANKKQYANDTKGLKAANMQNAKNYRTQLKTILTADQLQKLKADNAEKRANRKQNQTPHQVGGNQ